MILLTIVLLVFASCSAQYPQERTQINRDLEHRNNLALLTNIHLGDDKPLNDLSPSPPSISIPPGVGPHSQPLGEPHSSDNPPPAVPSPLTNDISLDYAPGYRLAFVNAPATTFVQPFPSPQFPYENIPLGAGTNLIGNNLIQNVVPQDSREQSQIYQYQVTKEVPVPQPYPVNIVRTVHVPVQVRVPVEVPKPYEVRVPHPVPVPVHIRVPVPVEKPYPVQVTKTVAVPVEKPVYIRVPQPVGVPVPQPYPVGVPQPVQIKVPVVVRIAEGSGNGATSELVNLDGTPFVPSAPVVDTNVAVPPPNVQPTSPPTTPPTVEVSTPRPAVTVAPSNISPFTGNGLLPPPPPTRIPNIKSIIGGLLTSYVGSKEGGVYRRGTKYQTAEYRKTW